MRIKQAPGMFFACYQKTCVFTYQPFFLLSAQCRLVQQAMPLHFALCIAKDIFAQQKIF
jgi:hypothetical protein